MAISERHRMAALTRWSREDPREFGQKIREARYRKFLQLADPESVLPEGERERRAQALIDAHCARMRLAKAQKARAT
jgi:hypothetical protein